MPCRCCGASRPSKGFSETGEDEINKLLKQAAHLILIGRPGWDDIEEWKKGWQEAFDHHLNGCTETKKWKRPWNDKPPEKESYICVFNDGGDHDTYLKTGLAVWNDKDKCHYIEPRWLEIDAYMRFWCELPEPPHDMN